LASTPRPHRLPRSTQSNVADQYALTFQAQTAEHPDPGRNSFHQNQPPETRTQHNQWPPNRSRGRKTVASDPSWQSVPKKLPQSEDIAPERPNPNSGNLDDLSFLRLPEVKAFTGLSKTSLYEMIRNKTFPAPVRLGPRSVAWVRSEVRQWAVERVQASRPAA
jgi:prophage regulatory protein